MGARSRRGNGPLRRSALMKRCACPSSSRGESCRGGTRPGKSFKPRTGIPSRDPGLLPSSPATGEEKQVQPCGLAKISASMSTKRFGSAWSARSTFGLPPERPCVSTIVRADHHRARRLDLDEIALGRQDLAIDEIGDADRVMHRGRAAMLAHLLVGVMHADAEPHDLRRRLAGRRSERLQHVAIGLGHQRLVRGVERHQRDLLEAGIQHARGSLRHRPRC